MADPVLSRRTLIAAVAAAPFAGVLAAPLSAQAALAPADAALVQRAVAYLEGLNEAKGRFTQIDARGGRSQGTLYLKRPGKARFAYDAPSGLLVVADGSAVSVADSRLKTFEKYPLAATPLSLFLARQVRLDRGVNIVRVQRMADGFTITARDAKKQAEGQIVLTFRDAPLRLAGWTIVDAQGQPTRVQIDNLAPTSGLPGNLFALKDPRPRAPGNRGG